VSRYERLYIEISNVCNLQCSFCPEVIRDKKILSLEDFKKYAQQAKPLARQICLHLMGEPLAHPEFSQIMDVCSEMGLRIFLTTNGTLLNRHIEKISRWEALDQINFSVHSYFANTARQSLDDYLRPILNFCDLSYSLKHNFYINLRLWNLPQADLQASQNIRVLEALRRHFNVQLSENVDVRLGKSKKIRDRLYVHFDTEFIWPDLKQSIRSEAGTCYGLRKQLAIHANGDVVPCCLDKESVLRLGNLNNQSLTDILKSPRATNIRSGFERGELVEDLCRRCQYADRFRTTERLERHKNDPGSPP